jgi:1-deoxy-D-xylulose-5-phosphate reductoisomerase
MKTLAILGSTGSIGVNACAVVAAHPERFAVAGLAAGGNVALLAEQIERLRPAVAAVRDEEGARQLQALLPAGSRTRIAWGADGCREVATLPAVETVLSAIAGAAGLLPTVAAIAAGKDVALANKETLVMAGSLVTALARERGVRIVPVDSEHSAVFQCLAGQRREDVARIILTASGGPFLSCSAAELTAVTPAQALRHPRWQMGPKVTIDSATLMNKGLEVIEAMWLFGVESSRIAVLIHPESIVHSLVELVDGALLAQFGVPDMRLPIAYALAWPERLPGVAPPPGLSAAGALHFAEPDPGRFPCLRLAAAAAAAGGTMPAVMNAADEIAVDAFLAGRIGFTGIPALIEAVMGAHRVQEAPDLGDIMDTDRWARGEARRRLEGNATC